MNKQELQINFFGQLIKNDLKINNKKYQAFCDLGVRVLVTIDIFFFFLGDWSDSSF